MDVTRRRQGEVLILGLSGPIAIGEGEREAGRALRAALAAGETKILLDMAAVPMVDSAGLGELVSVYAGARKRCAAMKLVGLSRRVLEVLRITQVIGLFDVFDDEATAVASFG